MRYPVLLVMAMLTTCGATPLKLLKDLTARPDLQQSFREFAADEGLSCPVPIALYDAGENAFGKISRIDCQSNDHKKTWSLRWIVMQGGGSRYEPW